MCGIAGIVKVHPHEAVEEGRLVRMRDTLRHRGPDDGGMWIDGPAGLATRRPPRWNPALVEPVADSGRARRPADIDAA